MEQQSGKRTEKPFGAPWLYPPILSLDLFLLVFDEVTREGPLPSGHLRLVLSYFEPNMFAICMQKYLVPISNNNRPFVCLPSGEVMHVS